MQLRHYLAMALLAAGWIVPLAGAAQLGPGDGAKPREIVLTAGVADNFAPGDPERAEASASLMRYMNTSYHPELIFQKFDQASSDQPVGQTFHIPDLSPEHPGQILKAVLTIKLRVVGGPAQNDSMDIFVDDEHGNVRAIFASLLPDLNGGTWQYGSEKVLRIDLANLPGNRTPADVRQELGKGVMHIYVQDDTAVDYVRWDLEYVPSVAAPTPEAPAPKPADPCGGCELRIMIGSAPTSAKPAKVVELSPDSATKRTRTVRSEKAAPSKKDVSGQAGAAK